MTDKISEAFGIESKEIIRPPKKVNQVPATQDDFTAMVVANKKEDYVDARDNIRNLISEVELVVGDAVDEVRSNPSPRMFETFALLVRTYADLNKDLIDISGKQSNGTNKPDGIDSPEKENSHINNVVFVGTSDSLIDQIRSYVK
jgi:hypothetical protein